jgi:hypothetical protein
VVSNVSGEVLNVIVARSGYPVYKLNRETIKSPYLIILLSNVKFSNNGSVALDIHFTKEIQQSSPFTNQFQ